MNLSTFIKTLRDHAAEIVYPWGPGTVVRMDYLKDPYELWNNVHTPEDPFTFPALCLSPLQTATIDGGVTRYRFILYAADQLLEGGDNYVYALDAAEYIIRRWLRVVERTTGVLDITAEELQPFTQKFADVLAGYYTTIELTLTGDEQRCTLNELGEFAPAEFSDDWFKWKEIFV